MDFSKHYRIAEAVQILESVKLYGHMAKPIEIGATSVTVKHPLLEILSSWSGKPRM